jgi:hypothetical protein
MMSSASSDSAHRCPVCGYDLGFEPWRNGSPSDEICPSCGIQFGYDDVPAGAGIDLRRAEVYAAWRAQWIRGGMRWWSSGRRPPQNWNPQKQLDRLGQPRRSRLRWIGIILGAIVGALFGITTICVAVAALTGHISRPERWVIPAGYQGWIVVKYNDPTCLPTPNDGLYRVFRVSSDGRVCTSSSSGHALSLIYQKFEYVSSDGKRTGIPQGDWERDGVQAWEIGYDPVRRLEWYYIGTAEQVQNFGPKPSFSSTPTP